MCEEDLSLNRPGFATGEEVWRDGPDFFLWALVTRKSYPWKLQAVCERGVVPDIEVAVKL